MEKTCKVFVKLIFFNPHSKNNANGKKKIICSIFSEPNAAIKMLSQKTTDLWLFETVLREDNYFKVQRSSSLRRMEEFNFAQIKKNHMFGNLTRLITNLITFCMISLWPDGLSILVEMEITRVGNKILNNSIIFFFSSIYNYMMRSSVYCLSNV